MDFEFGVRLAGDPETIKLNGKKTKDEIKHKFCEYSSRSAVLFYH